MKPRATLGMRRVAAPAVAVLSLSFALTPVVARAAWQPEGIPHSTASAYLYRPTAAPDGAGGIFVASGGGEIRIQHLTASGEVAAGWSAGGIPLPSIPEQWGTRLCSDGSGGVFVAWVVTGCTHSCHGDPGAVTVQHLLADGSLASGWPPGGVTLTTELTQQPPVLIPDGEGGAVVGWWSEFPVLDRVTVQRIDADGTPLWAAGGVVVAPASDGTQIEPRLATDGAGGALVAWVDRRSGAVFPSIHAQHVTAAGSLADPAGVLVSEAALSQRRPEIVADGANGAFVAWFDSTAAGWLVRAQHLGPGADPSWPASTVLSAAGVLNLQTPSVLSDSAGGVLVAWSSNVPMVGRLDATGQPPAPWPVTGMPIASGSGYLPRLVTDGAGGFFAAWTTSPGPMRAIRRDPDGALAPGWTPDGAPLCTGDCGPMLFDHALVADGAGGAIDVWDEERIPEGAPAGPERCFVQKLVTDGIVATTASLVSLHAEPGVVRIEWWVSEPAVLQVERTDDLGASWRVLAPLLSDGSGRVSFEDRAVRPATRYGYRLAAQDAGTATVLDEQWIQTPAAAALRLSGLHPNPAAGAVSLDLSLATGDPALVDVLDLAGRRVLSMPLPGFEPGAHRVTLPGSGSLRAGVYLVRLTQSGQRATVAVTLLR